MWWKSRYTLPQNYTPQNCREQQEDPYFPRAIKIDTETVIAILYEAQRKQDHPYSTSCIMENQESCTFAYRYTRNLRCILIADEYIWSAVIAGRKRPTNIKFYTNIIHEYQKLMKIYEKKADGMFVKLLIRSVPYVCDIFAVFADYCMFIGDLYISKTNYYL